MAKLLFSRTFALTNSGSKLVFNHPTTTTTTTTTTKRLFWGWLNTIFNLYDGSRVKDVGPDRAAAEWLIRCGAGVKWNTNSADWFRDYNSLAAFTTSRDVKIVEIDGTDSAVMSVGFKYFEGLTQCRKIIFHKSSYLEDDALKKLGVLDHCLRELQVSSCGNITSEGVESLAQLKKLEKLFLYDLPEIKDQQRLSCLEFLHRALPTCDLQFPSVEEVKKQKKLEEEEEEQAAKAKQPKN